MGFRSGAYATVWSVEPKRDTITNVRISISRKNKQTGEYEQDFGGFVDFVGTATAKKAAELKEKDRIKLGDVDVRTSYDKERNKSYTNFTCFSFESADVNGQTQAAAQGDTSFLNIDDSEVVDDMMPF